MFEKRSTVRSAQQEALLSNATITYSMEINRDAPKSIQDIPLVLAQFAGIPLTTDFSKAAFTVERVAQREHILTDEAGRSTGRIIQFRVHANDLEKYEEARKIMEHLNLPEIQPVKVQLPSSYGALGPAVVTSGTSRFYKPCVLVAPITWGTLTEKDLGAIERKFNEGPASVPKLARATGFRVFNRPTAHLPRLGSEFLGCVVVECAILRSARPLFECKVQTASGPVTLRFRPVFPDTDMDFLLPATASTGKEFLAMFDLAKTDEQERPLREARYLKDKTEQQQRAEAADAARRKKEAEAAARAARMEKETQARAEAERKEAARIAIVARVEAVQAKLRDIVQHRPSAPVLKPPQVVHSTDSIVEYANALDDSVHLLSTLAAEIEEAATSARPHEQLRDMLETLGADVESVIMELRTERQTWMDLDVSLEPHRRRNRDAFNAEVAAEAELDNLMTDGMISSAAAPDSEDAFVAGSKSKKTKKARIASSSASPPAPAPAPAPIPMTNQFAVLAPSAGDQAMDADHDAEADDDTPADATSPEDLGRKEELAAFLDGYEGVNSQSGAVTPLSELEEEDNADEGLSLEELLARKRTTANLSNRALQMAQAVVDAKAAAPGAASAKGTKSKKAVAPGAAGARSPKPKKAAAPGAAEVQGSKMEKAAAPGAASADNRPSC